MRNRSPRQDCWNRVAEKKSVDATGRPNELASFLGLHDAKFSCKKLGLSTKKEKKEQKRTEGL